MNEGRMKPPRPYISKELQIVYHMALVGYTSRQIGAEVGRSGNSIISFCRRNKIKLKMTKFNTHAQRAVNG